MADEPTGAPSEAQGDEPPVVKTEVRPARGRTFLPELTGVEFSIARRGYDRDQVDQYVERVSRIIVELEAMRSPDAVIERALADVGEETSAILRRARKAAEEILADAENHGRETREAADAHGREIREQADRYSAKVRADAEEVLAQAREQAERIAADATTEAAKVRAEATADAGQVRAEADAYHEQVRAEADAYHEQVNSHIQQLGEERQRLIEDLRELADHFHRAADRALAQTPRRQSHETAGGNGGGAPSHSRTA